jgi:3-oxoacyl-[acyl-carrier protein] reductase
MAVLQNKTALITGASRGIGEAIARRLSRDGAEVILHYSAGKTEAEAIAASLKAAGGKASVLRADLSKADAVKDLVAQLDGRKVDILVNNAGVAPFAAFSETTPSTFDEIFTVNVRSLFFVTQAVLRGMPDGGRIVNLSSVVTRTPFPNLLAYSASKGAVDVITLHLAAEVAKRHITVNAVSPGAIDTRMSAWIHGEGGKETLAQIQALPGIGHPEHIAGVVAFLAGPDGAWTTGQVIDASGGTKL